MPAIDRHAPGAFCWIELATTDQAGAKRFYQDLLGWEARDLPMGAGEVYTMFEREGRKTGAAYTMRAAQRELGTPPNWMLYIAVAEADASARRAAELGGTVLAPPFEVMDAGRLAVVGDPTGAIVSLWQAKKHIGLGLSGPNTFCWADLSTPDPARARAFYEKLFGWQLSLAPGASDGYLHIKNAGQWMGGIPPTSARDPMAPPHWMIWFDVADCEASVRAAAAGGARTLLPPTTMERVGRFSVLSDPQGAIFGVITPAAGSAPTP